MHQCLRRICASLLIASGVALFTSASHAQAVKERTIRFAFVNEKDHPHGLAAQHFADLVKAKSGGKISVKLFPGGTLGSDPTVVSSLQGGTIDMTALVTGILAGHTPEFMIFDLPFLFDDAAEADAVADGPVGTKLLEKLPAKGLVGLGFWDHGFRHVTTSKRPITKLEDIQGLKIRVLQIPIYPDMFNALGANAVPLPFTELYTALETGTVDAQENPWTSLAASRLDEVQKFGSMTGHVYNALVVLFSKKSWDKLSGDEQKILQDALNETTQYQRKLSREMAEKSLEIVKSRGLTVNEMPAQERARMREKLQPVTDKYAKVVGEELVKEAYSEIEKVRAHK
jgi:TRAP-type transport system periplasmic protein